MKKGLTLVLCASLAAFSCLAACKDPHEHSYSKEWSHNETNHWHANNCDDYRCEESLKKDEADHVDANEDGTCDVCSYKGLHVHSYSDSWTHDDKKHWHAANCGHDLKKDEADHKLDDLGTCTICNSEIKPPEIKDVEDAIDVAFLAADRVTSGIVTAETEYVDVFSTKVVTSYTFYDDYLYMSQEDVGNELGVTNEWWYEEYNGTIFGFEKEAGSDVKRLTEANESNLLGYEFGCEFMGGGEFFYGVEDMISGVYDTLDAANGKVDTEIKTVQGKKVYVINIKLYASEYDYYYLGTLEFTLGKDYNVETVNINTSSYYMGQYDVTIDEEGGYIVTLKEDAVASWNYSVKIEQNNKAIDYVANPYDPAKILVNSFKIVDGSEKEVTQLDMRVGDKATLYVKNILPDTAEASLNKFVISIDGQPADWMELLYATSNNTIIINAKTVGEHTVTVTCGSVVKTIKYNVQLALPNDIDAIIEGSAVTKAEVFVGKTLQFKGEVNANADPVYTATITSANKDKATLTAPTEEGGNYIFSATQAGEYVITITSTSKPSVTTTLTITVKEVPDMSEVLVGEYVYDDSRNDTTYSIVFTPAEEGALNGTAVITKTVAGVATTANATYVYNVSVTTLTVEYAVGSQLQEVYAINDNFEVVVKFATFDGVMARPTTEEPVLESGTLVLVDNMGSLDGTYQYKENADGTYSFYQDGTLLEGWSITVANGVYTFACSGLPNGAPLVAQEGQTELVGKWNINFLMNGLYVLTFTPDEPAAPVLEKGTVEIKDNNNGKFSGTYKYQENEDGTYSFYQDGTLLEGWIITVENGTYTFAFAGLPGGAALVATQGQTELVGKWNINFLMNGLFVLTFTPDEEGGGDDPVVPPVETENKLVLGENTVEITDTYAWEDEYTFVADKAGTYTITIPNGVGVMDENMTIVLDPQDPMSEYATSATFTLAEGEAITFLFSNSIKGEIIVTITEGGEVTPPEDGDEETTLNGTYNINSIMQGLYVLVFDAEKGTLVVTDNNNGAVSGTYGYSVTKEDGVVITLNGEETSVIIISTDIDGNYTFQCEGLPRPQVLVKVEEDEKNEVLVVGENTVVVDYNNFEEYTFVADKAGEYTFVSEDVVGFDEASFDNPPIFEGTYTVKLDEGETITIYLLALVPNSTSGTVNISYKESSGDIDEPEDLTVVIGENSIVVSEKDLEEGGMVYTFVAAEAGNYTFASNNLLVRVTDANGVMLGTGSAQLEAGTYTLNIVTSFLSSAGTYTLNISFEAISEGGGEGTGAESDPYVLESLPETLYVADSNSSDLTWYTFTATASGTLTITFDNADNWCRVYDVADSYEWLVSAWNSAKYEVAITAGTTYNVGFGNWTTSAPVTITFALAGSEGGSGEVTPPEPGNTVLVLGENTVVVTDTYSWIDSYTFTATKGGEYTLILSAGLGLDDNLDDWDAIVGFYDNENGAYAVINLEAGASITLYFGAVETGEYTVTIKEGNALPVGVEDNPIVLEVGTNEIEISEEQVANYYVYFKLTVVDAGWYTVNGSYYVSYNYDGVPYAELDGKLNVYLEANGEVVIYSEAELGTLSIVITAMEDQAKPSEGKGDSAENAIEVNAGAYGVYVDYDVCEEGLYVKFVAPEVGMYTVSADNFNAAISYGGVKVEDVLTLNATEANAEFVIVLGYTEFSWETFKYENANGSYILTITATEGGEEDGTVEEIPSEDGVVA